MKRQRRGKNKKWIKKNRTEARLNKKCIIMEQDSGKKKTKKGFEKNEIKTRQNKKWIKIEQN